MLLDAKQLEATFTPGCQLPARGEARGYYQVVCLGRKQGRRAEVLTLELGLPQGAPRRPQPLQGSSKRSVSKLLFIIRINRRHQTDHAAQLQGCEHSAYPPLNEPAPRPMAQPASECSLLSTVCLSSSLQLSQNLTERGAVMTPAISKALTVWDAGLSFLLGSAFSGPSVRSLTPSPDSFQPRCYCCLCAHLGKQAQGGDNSLGSHCHRTRTPQRELSAWEAVLRSPAPALVHLLTQQLVLESCTFPAVLGSGTQRGGSP